MRSGNRIAEYLQQWGIPAELMDPLEALLFKPEFRVVDKFLLPAMTEQALARLRNSRELADIYRAQGEVAGLDRLSSLITELKTAFNASTKEE